MSKQKLQKAPAPEAPKHELPATLRDELAAIVKITGKVLVANDAGAKELPQHRVNDAIDALALVRQLLRDTTEQSKAAGGAIVPDTVALRLKNLDAERKALLGRASELEDELADGLQALIAEGKLSGPVETPSHVQLALIPKLYSELVSDQGIGDEYLLPRAECVDWGKVEEQLKLEVAKAEAAKLLNLPAPVSKVPFAKLSTRYVLRTTLPKIIED